MLGLFIYAVLIILVSWLWYKAGYSAGKADGLRALDKRDGHDD